MEEQDYHPPVSFDIECVPTDGAISASTVLHNEPVRWRRAFLIFIFPALGGLLYGFDVGASSGALVSLTSADVSGTAWYALTALQEGMVVGASLFGALAGSVLAFVSADLLGRRGELLLASLLFALGSLGTLAAWSFGGVLLARCVYGLGIGYGMHAAPAYIAETAPACARGLFISLKEALVVTGVMLGYAAGYVWIERRGGWRAMYGVAVAPALALSRLHGAAVSKETVARELAEMELALADAGVAHEPVPTEEGGAAHGHRARASRKPGLLESLVELTRPRYRRPLQIGVSLMVFQQITGQPSVLYYAASTFQAAGFKGSEAATGISIVLGLFKMLMTLVAVATVDRLGRRPLLLGGVAALTVSLFSLALASSHVMLHVSHAAAAWTSLAALLLFVGSYQLSFGPLSWLMVSEIFPLRVRGQAIAVATFCNFTSNFIVSLLLPSIREAIGPAVPETKGKTLEEIEMIWSPQ
ncbi:hypothetical protein QBZ16_004085 [Prototheca wickerhamii]|uniref:Major facilitator superfamily (MFS) profile domain-containing protein n=1 Tax=Prototheca wickerhamii TaxID=3111 RepID=A0AAD9IL55_PROWI|nr:hypothetical protein QBZ16_004085 [Prototheca wickerhamii]